MINRNIARRYAKALFKAVAAGAYQECYDELASFSNAVRENESLNGFLANPVFSRPDKKAVMDSLIERFHISQLSANFLKLLVDKRRITLLTEILESYRDIMDKELGRVRITVKTAFPLSKELSESLREELEKITGSHVEMAVLEEPELLGGVVVRIGNTYYDGSVRSQLSNIQNLLGEEI